MTLTIKEAFEEADDKNVTLEVKVMEIIKTEKNAAGKDYKLIRIGDGSGTTLLKLYKEDQFTKFADLPSLLLINVIKKPTTSFLRRIVWPAFVGM